jgi:hypothetical protein
VVSITLKVIVLIGVQDSGKTTTLEKFVKHFDESVTQRHYYRHDGKLICVYFGSPQELFPFCNYGMVIENVIGSARSRVKKAETRGCGLIVLPFTLQVKEGKMNRDCIEKPIRELERKGIEAHIVYLRREKDDEDNTLECLQEMDELMTELEAKKIASDNEPEGQARLLFRIVKLIDP